MKKSELKAMIKECVKEALFEEGILSEIIAEVAFGITKAQNLIAEAKEPEKLEKASNKISVPLLKEKEENHRKRLLETKRKMLDAIGGGKMKNVFEGTKPLSTSGSPGSTDAGSSPLSGVDPSDSGVDISNLFNLAGDKWKALK